MSLRLLAVLAGLFAGLAFSSEASASWTTGAVNLRAGPGVKYGVLLTVPAGASISVKSCASRWCRVSYAGRRGWVSAAYIDSGNDGDDGYAEEARGGWRYLWSKPYRGVKVVKNCPIPRNYQLYAQGNDAHQPACPKDWALFPYGAPPYFDSQYYHSSWRPR